MQNVKTTGLAQDAGDLRRIATSLGSNRTARKPAQRTVMMWLDGVTQARVIMHPITEIGSQLPYICVMYFQTST